jgi:hypothetical protein
LRIEEGQNILRKVVSKMRQMLVACVAVAFGANMVSAASPPVDAAMKKIQGVVADAGKMQLFCELDDVLEAAPEDKEDPAIEKRIDELVERLGTDFAAAWDTGEELPEESADGKEYFAALDAIGDKCP